MSWLNKQFKSGAKIISKNGRGLGRTIEKYGAPIAAGALALTGAGLPASMAIMGATKAGGSLLAGHNLKQTLKSGATGVGQGALSWGAGKALGAAGDKVGGMLGMGKAAGSAAPTATTAGLTIPTGAKMAADGTLQAARTMSVPMLGNGATQAPGIGSRVLGGLAKAGTIAKENPLVVGQVASGVLQARSQGEANAIERKRFEEEERRKRQTSELLAPLFTSTLGGYSGMTTPYTPYKPNFG